METETRVMMVAEPMFGMVLRDVPATVHAEIECEGESCPLHNPSDHPLRDAEMLLRLDKGGLIERLCEHGIGHNDPDSVDFFMRIGNSPELFSHGCDGCCRPERLRHVLAPDEICVLCESGEHEQVLP